jgi:hypothetical protein
MEFLMGLAGDEFGGCLGMIDSLHAIRIVPK